MKRPDPILMFSPEGTRRFVPTSLDKLGKSEEFLESIIAGDPDLLQLENRRTNVRGPFKEFRQVSLPTPVGRVVYPDIVLFTASGHIVVVEVKLGINPELRNRSVLAQIIEYAASFSRLDESDLIRLLGNGNERGSWESLVSSWFGEQQGVDELAEAFTGRLSNGEINLVIVCDRAPAGLSDLIAGICATSPLGFDLDLMELAPYQCTASGELMFLPLPRLETEIVARTAVSVRYEATSPRPVVEVWSDNEGTLEASVSEVNNARRWSIEEVEAAFTNGSLLDMKLLTFCKQESARGQCVSAAPKKIPTFGYMLDIPANGKVDSKMIFYVSLGFSSLSLNLNHIRNCDNQLAASRFLDEMNTLFGESIDLAAPMPTVRYSVLESRVDAFLEACRNFKADISQ